MKAALRWNFVIFRWEAFEDDCLLGIDSNE